MNNSSVSATEDRPTITCVNASYAAGLHGLSNLERCKPDNCTPTDTCSPDACSPDGDCSPFGCGPGMCTPNS